ncbi:tRNA lysidine(34) synthetase TilS [Virgibacillus ainsalahensis]
MKHSVTEFIKRHQLLTENATVLVGVSGGPDSMALLHYLVSIRDLLQLKLVAVSVDHQLRKEESKADLKFVKRMCDRWDVQFIGASLDVPAYKKNKQVGTQIAARELRYQFFAEQMERFEASYLALGHHGDDQVETMLMGLARTATSSSFSGIPVRRPFATGSIIRPFLPVTKEEIEAYCTKHHITPRIDPSNNETTYTRNFYRINILPRLKEKNSNIHTTVQHLSESLHEDEHFLRAEAEKVFANTVNFAGGGSKSATLEINAFHRQPRALQRRVFHLILNYLYDKIPKDLSYVHEEQFFTLLNGDKGNIKIDFPFDLKLEKSYEKLKFYFLKHPLDHTFHETLKIPGRIDLPDGSVVMARYMEYDDKESRHSYVCNLGQVALPLHIRNRKPGDRMRWKGLDGSKKIKDIFIDEKIPKAERDKWPVLTDSNGEILWLIGLKKGQPLSQTQGSSTIQIYYENRDV